MRHITATPFRLLAGAFALAAVAVAPRAVRAEEWLDRVGEALAISSRDGTWRARLHGLLDLEGYHAEEPVADLVFTERAWLVNPRLTLFLDAQLGGRVYAFAQARIDRGFDPADASLRLRADEYAVRFVPWEERHFQVQAGKFATVVGNWTARHDSWANPFVTPPLPYDNLTAIWDESAALSLDTLLRWSHVQPASGGAGVAADADQRVPVIWGGSYTSGVAVAGAWREIEYAVELKNASLSSAPYAWDAGEVQWQEPTVSGRVGWRPSPTWSVGLSASDGTYLVPDARPTLAEGAELDDHRQRLAGVDVAYAHRHLQVWAEAFFSRFDVPGVGALDTLAYYVEAKYKFAPRFSAALRWNQQTYERVTADDGARVPWSRNTWRIDVAPCYRFTAHVQLKLQYSLRHEHPAPRALTSHVATQLTVRF